MSLMVLPRVAAAAADVGSVPVIPLGLSWARRRSRSEFQSLRTGRLTQLPEVLEMEAVQDRHRSSVRGLGSVAPPVRSSPTCIQGRGIGTSPVPNRSRSSHR